MQRLYAILTSLLVTGMLHSAVSVAEPATNAVPDAQTAIAAGLDWLAAQQKPNGAWSNDNFPALTALPLQAFLQSDHPLKATVVSNALHYILACVQDDGGIYVKALIPGRGGLGVYNTAICVTALHAANNGEYTPIILKARQYLAGAQLTGDDEQSGGFGYGPPGWRRSTDLNNTLYAIQAMRLTQGYEDQRPAGEKQVSLNWDAAVAYLKNVQNTPEDGEEEAGGFHYAPGESGAAGKTTNAKGEVVFRAYGSMTYVGLLAMIYADLPRTDPRVRSAVDWATRHWTLEENPGVGDQGMYFFYHVLTRALSAYGQESLPRENAEAIAWKTAVTKKLMELQRPVPDSEQRYWVNPSGRYWENDPVLVTSYCLLALLAM